MLMYSLLQAQNIVAAYPYRPPTPSTSSLSPLPDENMSPTVISSVTVCTVPTRFNQLLQLTILSRASWTLSQSSNTSALPTLAYTTSRISLLEARLPSPFTLLLLLLRLCQQRQVTKRTLPSSMPRRLPSPPVMGPPHPIPWHQHLVADSLPSPLEMGPPSASMNPRRPIPPPCHLHMTFHA